MTGAAHYHIDTDMGVDDGLALLLANRLLGSSVTVSTVFGNVPVHIATRNALVFRALLERTQHWPVLAGASQALDGFTCDARHVHGADGLGGATDALDPAWLDSVAAGHCVQLADAPPPAQSDVVLIGLGPATNIPRLAAWYGRGSIRRVVLMSGVYFDVGNITGSAEFNAHCDPDALRETLALGIPTTIVPLDLCRKIELPRGAITARELSCTTSLGRVITTSNRKYMAFCRDNYGIDGCNPCDAIAVLAAIAPERFYSIPGKVVVDSNVETRGRTRVEITESHIDVLMGGHLRWAREAIIDVLAFKADNQGASLRKTPS